MVIKKRSFFILSFLWMLLFSHTTFAFASYEKIYDEAGLFSEEEREIINEKARSLSEKHELDVIVVTTNDSLGKSSSQYALDFYDSHGFGYEGSLDGVLYLLNMDEREVYIFTRDKGTIYIDSGRVEELLDQVYPFLGEEKYFESADTFLGEVDRMMEVGSPSVPDGESSYGYIDEGNGASEPSLLQKLGIYLLISIVIGGIIVAIMAMSNRGRSTVNARTYLEDRSFQMTKKRDRHYNTIITQQKIQQNQNSGGGGSTSGGGGIGGGGRKF